MQRVYEGHLGLRPIKHILTLLPDNALALDQEEITTNGDFYFLDTATCSLYRVRNCKRFRIKHMRKLHDKASGRFYRKVGDKWVVEEKEYVEENVKDLFMYFANEPVTLHTLDKDILSASQELKIVKCDEGLRISYVVHNPDMFERVTVFKDGRRDVLLSFPQNKTLYLHTKDTLVNVHLVSIYDKELTVYLKDVDVKNGKLNLEEAVIDQLHWLNITEVHNVANEGVLLEHECEYNRVVNRKVLVCTAGGEAKRLLNLIIELPKYQSRSIMRYVLREAKIPIPSGVVEMFHGVTAKALDLANVNVELGDNWILVPDDFEPHTMMLRIHQVDDVTGLKRHDDYTFLLTSEDAET